MNDVALICTHGFADVLTLARQNRADPYALHVPASPWLELLPPAWRVEVRGRIDATGREVEALDAAGIDSTLAALAALPRPPRAVAICLLFAHLNPAHEEALRARIAQRFPLTRIACSHQVKPVAGEYERTVATLGSLGVQLPGPVVAAMEETSRSAFAQQLEDIANQMQQRLVDEAVSTVVREAMDCAAAIFLPDGRMVAQARTLPLLLGSLSPAVAGLLDSFPISAMDDGCGYLVNDPWHGGTHLPDFTLMRPVRVGEKVVALVACVLHHQDVGGIAPGSVPTNATDILQEGLRIPPIQLYRAGEAHPRVMRMLCANSRMPDNLAGDLRAQWLCLEQGARMLAPLIARDADAFASGAEAALAQSEAATRAALKAAPDGEYVFGDALDGDGVTLDAVPLKVRIIKQGDSATLDLSECAPQTRGPMNASRGAVWAAVTYFARMLAPQAASNDGCTAPITLVTRPGTIVDPTFPAAVNARTNLVKLLANAFLGAWARALPAHMPAPNAAEVVVLSLGGSVGDNKPWLFTEIIASAAGGAPWGAGGSGVSTDVGNARNTPAEAVEAQAPIRVERVALRANSGGAGRHRGGDGVVRSYRLLEGNGSISYRGERHGIAPQGAAGGLPGTCAAARIERANGQIEHLPAKARVQWQAGDRLVIETAGAGGWGSTAGVETPA
ncbi:hydantoinase B/oxoprolinase family protein [Variovorax sp. VNK109]|uniref:hydantoinase B/oxoprolinase family protein n=1 Tax=Variovorax sp. VNK109 TaxID=3400919 RepID=UPI003C0AA03D